MKMEEMAKYLVEEGFADYEIERVLSNISDDATREDIRREAMALHLYYRGFNDDEIEELLSNISDDETKDEIEKRGMIKHLEEQGLTEEEAEEAVSEITRTQEYFKIYDLDVEKIYDSVTDLAEAYLEDEYDDLSDYILNSLDHENLGREVAEGEGYLILYSERIVHFNGLQIDSI